MSTHLDRLLTASLAMTAALCHAGPLLFDFETDADVAAWTVRSPQTDRLTRSDRFATSGQSSMQFTTPAYKAPAPEWPAVEAKPPVSDWREYDRLVIDITNPRPDAPFLCLFISDSKTPFRTGLQYRFDLPAQGYRRFVVPLATFPETVDRGDITILHIFSQRPEADVELYFDNIQLLRPEPAAPSPAFVRQIADLTFASNATPEAVLNECRTALAAFAAAPADAARVDAEMSRVRQRLDDLVARGRSGNVTLEEVAQLADELRNLPSRSRRLASRLAFERDATAAGLQNDRLLVGFATAAEKILPRAGPFRVSCRKGWEIALAR
jgi:hypothetical protein